VESISEQEWRGTLNQILYALIYARELDDSVADGVADMMMDRRMLPSEPEEYYQAISQALASDHLLGPQSVPTEHDEAALRQFLARLRIRLDDRRPWPGPRFVKLPPRLWPAFADAPAIARVDRAPGTVSEHVWEDFDDAFVGGTKTPLLLLRLRTGEVLALVGSTDPRHGPSVTVRLLEGDPAAALTSLRELANLREDQVVPL